MDRSQDPSPLHTAWREIREETSLTECSLMLFRRGREFTFTDEAIGREWTIFPFAFLLRSQGAEESIRLDWEHTTWKWFDVADVVNRAQDGIGDDIFVPRLAESLRRVYPEGDAAFGTCAPKLGRALWQLREDHKSGARELASIALKLFRDLLSDALPAPEGDARREWWDKVKMMAWHIWRNGRESMGASILSALLPVLAQLETLVLTPPLTTPIKSDEMLAVVDSSLEERTSITRRVCDSLASFVGKDVLPYRNDDRKTLRILTLSSSSTIREGILHLVSTLSPGDVDVIDLRILESRPLFEGVSLSAALSRALTESKNQSKIRLNITIYSDASAALAAQGIDIILIGADRIASDGAVSNKVGSLPAVLSAKHVAPQCRTVVVSELGKIAEPGESPGVEESTPLEVSNTWRADAVSGVEHLETMMKRQNISDETVAINVRNTYFEWVPAELIDVYICEQGINTVDDIRQRSEWVATQIDRVFHSSGSGSTV